MNTHHDLRLVAGNTAVLAALAACAAWLASLQPGAWLQAPPSRLQLLAAAACTALYLGACAWCWWRGRPRSDAAAAIAGEDAWLVAYASQTGFAEHIAERTVQTLRDAGARAELRALGSFDLAAHASSRCLFVVSTTGEGDPPDGALGFVRDTMGAASALAGLRYAVLALGDRNYRHYCAFGHQLDDWLRRAGAQPLFDLIEVDNGDLGALRHWQHHLGVLAGAPELPDWAPAPYQHWQLAARRQLNPGSIGGPAHALRLQPGADASLDWQAGDIAEIGPRNPPRAVEALLHALALPGDAAVSFLGNATTLADAVSRAHLPDADAVRGLAAQALCERLQALPHREYSIASIPSDGAIELLVRRMQRPDGTPGLGSGWLCEHAGIGQRIDLRIRSNRNFHPPQATRPMILIGNGTGIAGLRAHLKARIAAGTGRNCLLFGERNASADRFYGDELDGWLRDGRLQYLDRVYSRDGGAHRYVQDALRANGERLRDWLDAGAAVYVCGSLQGMAPGVDAVLVDLLGRDGVDALVEAGRYRRDVY